MVNDDLIKPVILKDKKVRKKLKKQRERTVGSMMISELLPFKRVMRKQLNMRGFSTNQMPFNQLAILYHNEFASNKFNTSNSYLPINSYEFCNNVAFKIKPSDNLNGDITNPRNRDYFLQIGGVVDNIVDTFKVAKIKKQIAIRDGVDPRKVLTSEELIQANATEKIQNNLEDKMSLNESIKLKDLKNVVIFAIVVYLIWYIFN